MYFDDISLSIFAILWSVLHMYALIVYIFSKRGKK